MNERSGRMSTTKKEGLQMTEERIEKSQTRPRRNIFESKYDKIMEFQRTGRYDLMHMKMKEIG
jgi:hypothetical protein